jgi:hypothetical protein
VRKGQLASCSSDSVVCCMHWLGSQGEITLYKSNGNFLINRSRRATRLRRFLRWFQPYEYRENELLESVRVFLFVCRAFGSKRLCFLFDNAPVRTAQLCSRSGCECVNVVGWSNTPMCSSNSNARSELLNYMGCYLEWSSPVWRWKASA